MAEALKGLSTSISEGIKASLSAAVESSRLTNEILQLIKDLRGASGNSGPLMRAPNQAIKSRPQSVDNDHELKLKLPFEKAFLEVKLRSHGVKPEAPGQYKSLSSRGIPEANRSKEGIADVELNRAADADALTQDTGETISVIMTTYNSAAYVQNAVLSVLEQTHNDLELIVVDDASSDNSFEILLELVALRSARPTDQVVHQPWNVLVQELWNHPLHGALHRLSGLRRRIGCGSAAASAARAQTDAGRNVYL